MSYEWLVNQHPAFEYRGPSGNPAITDLTVLRRGDETPVVIATERRDNPGTSITNGAERLGAQVLTRLFPDRADEPEPFILIEHHPPQSLYVGGPDYEAIESTFRRVTFADFRLRDNGAGVPNIGRVVKWDDIDRRSPQTQQLAVQQRVDQRNSMAQDDEQPAGINPARGLRLAR